MAELQLSRERRFYPRVPCALPLNSGETIHNISQNGFYLESAKNYQPNDTLSLFIAFPNGSNPLPVTARVARKDKKQVNGYGYGLCFSGLSAEVFQQIHYFILHQATKSSSSRPDHSVAAERPKTVYNKLVIQTERENLSKLDPRLADFLRPSDYFYVHNVTKELQIFVERSGVLHGTLTVQILHTSATLCVNELDEPMLLMDITRKLRAFAPKEAEYLHNSPLRHVNLCEDDTHCDQNGDAHVKSALFGYPSVTLIVQDGKLVLGQWQKVALLEFDGPRRREILIQLTGC